MHDVLKSLWIGARRRWIQGIVAALAYVGALWTVTEIATTASASAKALLDEHGNIYLAFAIAGSAVAFLIRVYEPRHVAFCIPSTATKVTLKFADLFEQDADIVVAVTEYIDGEIGQRVSGRSVHGQLIQRWFSSEAEFRNAVDAKLVTQSATSTGRSPGPDAAYPLGTTIRVSAGPKQAYIFVFAHADPVTDKAFVGLSEAIDAVRAMLLCLHQHASGRAVAMPLIGTGQSSLNLPPQHLLRLLVLLIVTVAREKALPRDVRICLHDDCFEELDLREIARDWRH